MGVSSIISWSKNFGIYKTSSDIFSRGMFIEPKGIYQYRFKSLTCYVFYLIFCKVENYLRENFSTKDENLTSLSFAIAMKLFNQKYRDKIFFFSSEKDQNKQVSPSNFWRAVMFFQKGLILIKKCPSGHVGPENYEGKAHCSCWHSCRNISYWEKFQETISQIIEEINSEENFTDSEIKKALNELILENSFFFLSIKPA